MKNNILTAIFAAVLAITLLGIPSTGIAGEIPIGGKQCPNGQTTCLASGPSANEAPMPFWLNVYLSMRFIFTR